MERGVRAMGPSLIYAAILLMLLAMLVLILVLVEGRKKSKRAKDSEVKISAPVKTVGSSAPTGSQPMGQVAYRPRENRSGGSIYAYTSRKSVRLCPGCDGENLPSRSRCMICGCEMGPTGR